MGAERNDSGSFCKRKVGLVGVLRRTNCLPNRQALKLSRALIITGNLNPTSRRIFTLCNMAVGNR